MAPWWSVEFLGSDPFAATINGAVADRTSVPTAFGMVAGLAQVVAWGLPTRPVATTAPGGGLGVGLGCLTRFPRRT